MLAPYNVDRLHVWHNRGVLQQDAQTGQISHPLNPGAPGCAIPQARPQRVKIRGVPLGGTLRVGEAAGSPLRV
jgi:hypothetical protein